MGILEEAQQLLGVLQTLHGAADNILPSDIADIVKQHAIAAAATAAGTAWLPGIGSTIATAASAGVVWVMYIRINKELNLSLSEAVIKGIAAGIGANLASYAGGLLVGTALSFIPGIGSVAASVIMCGVAYGLTIAAGFVYLKVLTELLKAGKNPATTSKEEFQREAKRVMETNDMKSIINEGKKEYEKSKKK